MLSNLVHKVVVAVLNNTVCMFYVSFYLTLQIVILFLSSCLMFILSNFLFFIEEVLILFCILTTASNI